MIHDMATLQQLAAAALTSVDAKERTDAADKLRYLSSYDHFDQVKNLLPMTNDNYLRFILLKAIQFIVSNEIGPQERAEIIEYVMAYISQCHAAGIQLPKFIMSSLYNIYARALYLNWKLHVISHEHDNKAPSMVGEQITSQLSQVLTPLEMLDCIQEILSHFAHEDSRSTVFSTRALFAKHVLPYFFQIAVGEVANLGTPALQLCCVVLESVPTYRHNQLMSLQLTTEETIYIGRSSWWFPALSICASHCGQALLNNSAPSPFNTECLKFLRLASTVLHSEREDSGFISALYDLFINLCEQLLYVCETTNDVEITRTTCAILVNMFERDEWKLSTCLYNDVQIVERWVRLATAKFVHWDEEEEELRGALLHLLFLVGDRAIPKIRRSRPSGSLELPSVSAHVPSLSPLRGMEDDTFSSGSASPATASLSQEEEQRAQQLRVLLMSAVEVYVSTLIEKAPLTEDSEEIRKDNTALLHLEQTVRPLAELLLCESLPLEPLVEKLLYDSIAQYEACCRARQGGSMSEVVLLSLAAQSFSALMGTLGPGDSMAFLSRVCLSRLSVIVSIVAIALKTGSVSPSQNLLTGVLMLGRKILNEDDAVTESLLSCMLVSANAGAEATSSMSEANQQGSRSVHLGVLRALFFFGNCVYTSDFGRSTALYEILVDLFKYTIVKHSDILCLVSDAFQLLEVILSEGVHGSQFFESAKMASCIQAVLAGNMPLLRYSGSPLSEQEECTRHGLLRAMTHFIESRYYAGNGNTEALPELISRILAESNVRYCPQLMYADLAAVAKGVHRSQTLWWLLDGVTDAKMAIVGSIEHNLASVPSLLRLLDTLCVLASSMIPDEQVKDVQWEFASMVMHAITMYFAAVGSDGVATLLEGCPADGTGRGGASERGFRGGSLFHFKMDKVPVEAVYAIFGILHELCSHCWVNLGVIALYEEGLVEQMLCGAMELLLSTSVEQFMSDPKECCKAFRAIISALRLRNDPGVRVYQLMTNENLWSRLLQFIGQCLTHSCESTLLACIHAILQEALDSVGPMSHGTAVGAASADSSVDARGRELSIPTGTRSDGVNRFRGKRRLTLLSPIRLPSAVVQSVFREIAALISITSSPSEIDLRLWFEVMTMCFTLDREGCDAVMDFLLDFCSAYHRVRLRSIHMMLKSSGGDLMYAYTSVFGVGSKVGSLSAW